MANETIVVQTKSLCKEYPLPSGEGVLPVLKGIDLTIARGEIIAVVGQSGAGKSTLLHMLGALDRPTSGSVRYGDQDIFSMRDDELANFRNAHVGFVFQFHHLLPEFTARENVAIPALMKGLPMRDAAKHADELLAEVGLSQRATHKPSELSGGEQQRVAVARALVNNPDVVLADEPTGNLDSANAEMLHEMLWKLSRKTGQTFIIVTHNEALARRADRVLAMKDGRLA
jgi:lipoprotein-releasing system ATP-binding protein